MRKALLILSGVVLYLLLGAGGAIPSGSLRAEAAATVGQSVGQERTCDLFHCERVCNSDFRLPVSVRVVVPRCIDGVRTMPSPGQASASEGGWAAAERRSGGYRTQTLHLFPAGARAADYYVFLLRRLLI